MGPTKSIVCSWMSASLLTDILLSAPPLNHWTARESSSLRQSCYPLTMRPHMCHQSHHQAWVGDLGHPMPIIHHQNPVGLPAKLLASLLDVFVYVSWMLWPCKIMHSLQQNDTDQVPSGPSFVVIVAIDFGTTSSGYAYAFTKEPECIHTMR